MGGGGNQTEQQVIEVFVCAAMAHVNAISYLGCEAGGSGAGDEAEQRGHEVRSRWRLRLLLLLLLLLDHLRESTQGKGQHVRIIARRSRRMLLGEARESCRQSRM